MRYLLLTILLLPLFSSPTLADVDVRFLRSIPLNETPLQTVATADGQQIYVLTDQGNVQIYSADGQLQGVFVAGPDVTGITPQGPSWLILQLAGRKEMVQVALEKIEQIATEGAPSLGNSAAPVTIVVFDDFECPYCAKAVPLLKEVLASYPEQVKLVYKNFPLSMHQHAVAAAIAGLAAEKQGKFWPLHDLLFDNYNQLNPEKIQQLAKQAGLDMVRFEQDRSDPQLAQQVNLDMQQGQQLGVRGTPTIFVNGRRLPQRSKAAFDQLIQAELAKVKPVQ
ncbi:MAG TPA: thioredoxin domain-containing protein [Malonomonas sp.]